MQFYNGVSGVELTLSLVCSGESGALSEDCDTGTGLKGGKYYAKFGV